MSVAALINSRSVAWWRLTLCGLAVNESLDRVPVVVVDDEDRFQTILEHGRDVLHGQLHRSVPREEDDATARSGSFFRGHQRSEGRTSGVSDRAPKDLRDESGAFRERRRSDAERRSAGFGHDDVALFEERRDHGPERFVLDHLVFRTVGNLGDESSILGRLRKVSFRFERGSESGEQGVERNVGVLSILHTRVVRVAAGIAPESGNARRTNEEREKER